MRKPPKKLLLAVGIALGLAGLICGACAWISAAKPFHRGDLTGMANEFSIIDREIPPLPVRDSGNFVILQFTDTHLIGTKGKDAKTLAAMEEALLRTEPDLVVVTGDMLDGFNKHWFVDKRGALCAAADIFERHGQYWAWVPGNNDGETLGSSADVAAFLGRDYPHCLVSNAEDIAGATQYVVPVVDAEGAIVHALVFLDSLGRDPETNYLTYDCMKKSQADWLRAQLAALKTQAPQAKASVFFHMNTPAFTKAKHEGEPYAKSEAWYGMVDFPDSWSIRGNEIVDRAIAGAGSVGLVCIGHLHPPANQCAYLDGTYYHITRASGYQAAKRPGAAVITIHTYDGSPRRLYDFDEITF
ncbi:MAG: metallophosphoesterase [Oscillospiraceae bacterium]|nr:metallophosphoesterase [Oscillospiraceae bacterium]